MQREIMLDSFAGGGGASTGIFWATGRHVDIAINHDEQAIAMHAANHPETFHYKEDVWAVDPVKATNGENVGLAWFSPTCCHFSKAKGAALLDRGIRGLAWVALKWAVRVRPRVIFLENVEEFKSWGPLLADGRPNKERAGESFQMFVRAIRRQGYIVEWKELRACDYGAPTTRKRLFLIARCDGQPIVWPEPTHFKNPLPGQKAWRTAAECIDRSIPCTSIFERKKPLADATLRRIARGIVKYVLDAKRPFTVTCNHSKPKGGEEVFRGQSLDEPFRTVTASRDAHGLVVPTLIQTSYGERVGQAPRVPGLEKPLGTVMAQGQKHALIGASLIQMGFGEAPGSPPRCIDIEKPLGTVLAGSIKHALAVATLIKNYGGKCKHTDVDINGPLHTVTATDHHSLVAANLIKFRGDNIGSGADEPVPTVTAQGTHIGAVYAFLSKYYSKGSNAQGNDLNDPIHTVVANDRFCLVTIDSVDYIIVDIGMRMLEPHELYRAQGFPEDYLIAPYFNGKKLSKKAQVRMCGNSVCPPLAAALVKANYKEMELEERENVTTIQEPVKRHLSYHVSRQSKF